MVPLYHFCRLLPLLSKHSEKKRNWGLLSNGQMIYVVFFFTPIPRLESLRNIFLLVTDYIKSKKYFSPFHSLYTQQLALWGRNRHSHHLPTSSQNQVLKNVGQQMSYFVSQNVFYMFIEIFTYCWEFLSHTVQFSVVPCRSVGQSLRSQRLWQCKALHLKKIVKKVLNIFKIFLTCK